MPYRLNLLHLFSYYNNSDGLIKAIEENAKYMRDKFKSTPLQYSMDRNSSQCTTLLLEFIMQTQNIYSTLTMDEITGIIKAAPDNLEDFFNESITIQDQDQPIFGTPKGGDINFKMLDQIYLDRGTACEMIKQGSEGEPIEYKSLKFKYNFQMGTKSSIKFHESLRDTDNDELFKSEAIQRILRYKWE